MKLMFFSLIVLFISLFILAGCGAVEPEKKMVLCAPSEIMRFTSTGHVIDCRTQKIHWM